MRARVALLLLTVLLAACGRIVEGGDAVRAPASAPRLLLAAQDVYTLASSVLASGPVVTGSIQPERRADLRAEVAAVVLQVPKENGEPVRTGDLLVRLDDTAIRDSLTSAEAGVRASAQAFEQAERSMQRLQTLRQQGMVSQQSLDDAEQRRNNAQSDLVAARARVATARQQLQRTLVRAPFDGVLSERKVSVGDTAAVGKELLKVIDPRSMRLEGLVSADRVQELRPGQPVSFRVNGYEGGDFTGRVRRIDPSANAATRQVALIVDFVDPAVAPRVAGLYAEGRVETGSTPALMVPESVLARAGEAASAWRLDAGKLTKVALKLGSRDARSGKVPVLEGLQAGDRILRNPGTTLVDGQLYDLAQPAAAAASQALVTAK